MIGPVDVLNVALPKPLHQGGEIRLGGRGHQQMDVVGHQHIGMNRYAARPRQSPKRVEIDLAVFIAEKAPKMVMACD